MKQYALAGVPLLPAEAMAQRHGVTAEAVWNWEAMGLVESVIADGRKFYREDAADALLAPASAPEPPLLSPQITLAQAAYTLGVDARTVGSAVRKGFLSRDARGLFDATEVRELHKARRGRKALRPALQETTLTDPA
jgi:hypothetical protein